jgi:L-ascorbate metabolism protein UlaG (beta-lactamase superfamily)
MTMRRAFVCAIALTVALAAGAGAQSIDVTYIGNAGFMVTAGPHKVLVDAMYDQGWDHYLVPSRSTRGRIKRAEPPFDGVDLILATHWHDDHFDEEIVAEHLRHSPGCTAVVTEQAADLLKGRRDFAKIESQVRAIAPAWGEVVDMRVGGIPLMAVGMKHVPYPVEGGVDKHRDVQAIGYIVTVGGVNLYHVGDAVLDVDDGFITSSGIGKRRIDIVFMEYFDRSSGTVRVIRELIRPYAVVATHIPPGEWERQSAAFRDTFDGAVVFRDSMERRTLDITAIGTDN